MYVVHSLHTLSPSALSASSPFSLSFSFSLYNGSSLQRPLIGTFQERDNASASAAGDYASEANRRRRRPTFSAGSTRREAHRFRTRPNRLRDLRRRVPDIRREASELRFQRLQLQQQQPQPPSLVLLHRVAESQLAELAGGAAIPHFHRR